MTTSGTADAYTTSLEDSAVVAVPTRFWWELAIVLWLYFLYDIINNLSPVSRASALAHAEDSATQPVAHGGVGRRRARDRAPR